MKLSTTLERIPRFLVSLILFFACPLFLSAQSNKKTTSSPPPPPAKTSAPPTVPKVTPRPSPNNPNRDAPQKNVPPPQPPQLRNKIVEAPGPRAKVLGGPLKVPGIVNRPDGGKIQTTPSGHTIEYGKTGHLEKVVTRGGVEAHYTTSGNVSTVKTPNGTLITHSPGGGRQIVTEHRDASGNLQSRVVTAGHNRGYRDVAFQRGGHDYMRRTYVSGGHTSVAVYRGYRYNGVVYYHYVPAFYYRPAFYAWGFRPWGTPFVYTAWGWPGEPWYGWSGYYFAPYAAYPSAAFWLTDYMVSEDLKAAYEAQTDTNASAPEQPQNNSPALNPEVKQMIAEEVKSQLAAEEAAAVQSGNAATPPRPAADTDQVPPALDPSLRVFIVTTSLDVTSNGQPCSLRPGDVLMRMENKPDKDNNTVGVSVVSSQKSDCAGGSSPRIQVADLQEMHNHFREQLDNGLTKLAGNQGKNGVPAGPAANPRPNPDGTAAPDDTAVITAQLKKQQQEADQAEKEIRQAASSTGNAD